MLVPSSLSLWWFARWPYVLHESSLAKVQLITRLIAGGEGGECILVKQHRIDPDCTSDSASAADNLAHPDNIGTSDPTPAPRDIVQTFVKIFYRDQIIDSLLGRGIMSSFHVKETFYLSPELGKAGYFNLSFISWEKKLNNISISPNVKHINHINTSYI